RTAKKPAVDRLTSRGPPPKPRASHPSRARTGGFCSVGCRLGVKPVAPRPAMAVSMAVRSVANAIVSPQVACPARARTASVGIVARPYWLLANFLLRSGSEHARAVDTCSLLGSDSLARQRFDDRRLPPRTAHVRREEGMRGARFSWLPP